MTARWFSKALLSLGYWLAVAVLMVARFTGDVVGVDGTIRGVADSPWPARLALAGAVLLWAALSWAYDRVADRR